MKGIYLVLASIIFITSVLFPLFSMRDTTQPPSSLPQQTTSDNQDGSDATLRVLFTQDNTIKNVSVTDYVTGVVLAEMPAEYDEEALKAQAVVAYTYAQYKANLRKNEDYDVTDSHQSDQAFLTETKAKERFGDAYQGYLDKVSSAVKAVKGITITYNKKPILASCHSISSGKTESAEVIWGGNYPYLKPVESVGDLLSPNYLSEVTVTLDEMKKALKTLDISPEGDAATWFQDMNLSDSGTVVTLKIGKKEIKGSGLRSALGLRSANFSVQYADSQFKFTVRGYGHGVGMSQYGAQFMALQGSSYEDILNWYYTDCEIVKP